MLSPPYKTIIYYLYLFVNKEVKLFYRNYIFETYNFISFIYFTIERYFYNTISLTLIVTSFRNVRRLFLHLQLYLLRATHFGYQSLITYEIALQSFDLPISRLGDQTPIVPTLRFTPYVILYVIIISHFHKSFFLSLIVVYRLQGLLVLKSCPTLISKCTRLCYYKNL